MALLLVSTGMGSSLVLSWYRGRGGRGGWEGWLNGSVGIRRSLSHVDYSGGSILFIMMLSDLVISMVFQGSGKKGGQ